MDHKLIDIVCGDISTLIAMKTLDLEHKSHYSCKNPDDIYRIKKPLFSGDDNTFANVILINDKIDADRLYSGISYGNNQPTTNQLSKYTKVFNQTINVPDNPYNFLSKSLVK